MVAIAVVATGAIAFLAGALVVRFGPRLGYLDRPDGTGLKTHRVAAVPLGGVGLWLAFHIGSAIAGGLDPWLLAASSLLLVLGLVDDKTGLSPGIRLGITVGAGVLLAIGVGDGRWDVMATVVFAVVIAVNAVNLFDGLDGLAMGTGAVSALGMAGLSMLTGSTSPMGLILAGALVGLLFWNRHPARLFLGDNGAYTMAIFLVATAAVPTSSPIELAAALCLMGVFFVDLIATVGRRLWNRRPLFAGDRSHMYDSLVAAGMTVPAVAWTSAFAQAGFVGCLLLVYWWSTAALTIAAAVILGSVLVAGFMVWMARSTARS